MEYLSVRIIISVPQILSLLAITYMFRCYLALRRRTLGLQMILILCIADFIFHAAFLCFTWTTDEQVNPQSPASAIMLGALRFSLFWASSIAYLALKSLSGDMKLDPVVYAKISFLIILIITVILGLVSAFVEQTLFFLLLTVFSPLLISLVWTTICYLRSISILKRHSKEKNIPIQETMRNLYIYSLIQIITSGPAVLYYFTVGYTQRGSLTWVTIVSVAVGFSGLANSSAYFFQRAMRKSMANLDRVENTGCLSNITVDSEPGEVDIDSS